MIIFNIKMPSHLIRRNGETVLKFLTLVSEHNISRMICHTQVVEYPTTLRAYFLMVDATLSLLMDLINP